jgi:hypothetical protein
MKGFYLTQAEANSLPMTGPAWGAVKAAADQSLGPTSLKDQDSGNNVLILAKALVYARTGDVAYRTPVLNAVKDIVTKNLEKGSRALALGRELAAYVIAADLVDLAKVDPALDAQFCTKLRALLTAPMTSGPATLLDSQLERPNNWGMHAGASVIAVALYLGDAALLDKSAKIFKGWLGDRTCYAGFKYGDLWWQPDPAHPVGICPKGAVLNNHNVDGSLPEELRRDGTFTWPPKGDAGRMYSWEALQGATLQAYLLNRVGGPVKPYPAWDWCDKALLRATQFLYALNWPAGSDDGWQPWVYNAAYGTTYPASATAQAGKNVGWFQWTATPAIVNGTNTGGGDDGGGDDGGGDPGGGDPGGGDPGGGDPGGGTDTSKLAAVLGKLTQVKGVLQQVVANVDEALKAGQ